MASDADVVDKIHRLGGKATPQRLMIHKLMDGNTHHPTAEMVFEQARLNLPTISLTTVYNVLNDLVAMGELKRFEVDGVSHYDPDTAPHAEVVCLQCGVIVDAPHPLEDAALDVPGFQVTRTIVTHYGYCSQCRPVDALGVVSSPVVKAE